MLDCYIFQNYLVIAKSKQIAVFLIELTKTTNSEFHSENFKNQTNNEILNN